ncbi:hypothetical protein [Vibrio sp. H11]|uniref:head-tail joining protein n=1 Tax=Vibrio sp. H11 TaxID=2565928 RepID=UPI0010A5C698|nr:hypothetical protein [Vibrio sp. H11]
MFDSEFDRLMDDADHAVYKTMGVEVRINGGDSVTAIYDENLNEFDAMSGRVSRLAFRRTDNVRVKRNDQIEFVASGKTAKVTSGPFYEDGETVVVL